MTTQLRDLSRSSDTASSDRVDARASSRWWAPLAAASIVAAVAHIPVTGEHLHEALYIGLLFIALEIAAVVLAVALVIRPTALVYALVAVVGGAAVLALVLSRTVGLPLISDDIGNWAEPLAVVSLVSETVMLVGGIIAARRVPTVARSIRPTIVAGVLVLVIGLVATVIATNAESSGDSDDTGGSGMAGMHMGMPAQDLGR